jgi:predicted lipoprotein
MSSRLLGLTCATVLLLGACAPSPLDDRRRELLQSWGSDLILPELSRLIDKSEQLGGSVSALCLEPSTMNLGQAREAWASARKPWERFFVFDFGPALDEPLRLGPQIDFWPVRTEAVDKALNSGSYATYELLGPEKGFGAIEYLLFGPASNELADVAPITASVKLDAGTSSRDAGASSLDAGSSGPEEQARCAYLARMTDALTADARRLRRAWDPKADGYLTQLTSAGIGSTEFDTLPMALGRIVNRMGFVVQHVRADKLATPFGTDVTDVELDKQESRFSQRAVLDILDNLEGVELTYFGAKTGAGLEDYLQLHGRSFATQMHDRLAAARRALERVGDPLDDAILHHREHVKSALDRLDELQRLIQVDILGALSLSLTFADNDGD